MKSVSKLQYLIIASSVLLFVLLFIANKKPEKKAEEQMPGKPNAEATVDIKTFADAQISVMPDSLKKTFATLEKNTKDTACCSLPRPSYERQAVRNKPSGLARTNTREFSKYFCETLKGVHCSEVSGTTR